MSRVVAARRGAPVWPPTSICIVLVIFVAALQHAGCLLKALVSGMMVSLRIMSDESEP